MGLRFDKVDPRLWAELGTKVGTAYVQNQAADANAEGMRQQTQTTSNFGKVDPNAVYTGEGADGAMTAAEAASYGVNVPVEDKTAGTGVIRQYGLGTNPQKFQDTEFTPEQRRIGGLRDQAGFYAARGDTDTSNKILTQVQQSDLTDMQLAQAKRMGLREDKVDSDAAALRAAMAGGIGAGTGLSNGQTTPAGAGDPLTTSGKPSATGDLQSYLSNVAPGVVKTLLSQGKVEEAKRFNDFVGSEQGKAYATAWTTGLRKHAMGDHAGAIRSFEKLYNDQLFNDGQTVKIEPIEDGKQYQVSMFDAKGNAVGSQTLDPEDLASQAAWMLEPTKAVEFHAQQKGKLDAEAAVLDRQLQIEGMRQKTTEIREERRDGRLVTRLQAGPQRGGLTATQQRSNIEIDAAREQVSSLDAVEIRRRTAKQTDTGRENPDYDPTLARASNLAGRRKVGEDQAFDDRLSGSGQQAPIQQAPGQGVDRQDVAKRFRSDKTMNSHRLGKDTPGGVEVLDKSGKVIGHYR